jgi:hypothetical protein
MPGVEYTVSVSGINMLGIQGKAKQFSFQVMPNTMKSDPKNEISLSHLVLAGPATTVSNADTYVEATFTSCEPLIMAPILNVSMQAEHCFCASYDA